MNVPNPQQRFCLWQAVSSTCLKLPKISLETIVAAGRKSNRLEPLCKRFFPNYSQLFEINNNSLDITEMQPTLGKETLGLLFYSSWAIEMDFSVSLSCQTETSLRGACDDGELKKVIPRDSAVLGNQGNSPLATCSHSHRNCSLWTWASHATASCLPERIVTHLTPSAWVDDHIYCF